ncbi:MAG: ribonuclease H family protein [Paludibacteraceae bacterium]|nr:ribonuclease H family protein [Paludibacteraceae bacterium]
MAKPKQKYYVVWQGRQPGVYTDWSSCEAQVKGFLGAKYKAFPTLQEAELAFGRPAEEYIVKNVKTPKADNHAPANPSAQKKSPLSTAIRIPALCVDAACSGNPGLMEYRGVYLLDIHQNGEREEQELFRRGPFPEGTNNIGEFLAIVHALALLQKQGNSTLPIYSDSKTAQAWVKQKKAKTKLQPTPANAVLFQMIQRAENWLLTHAWNNPLLKWDTPNWGEIPADFGRK